MTKKRKGHPNGKEEEATSRKKRNKSEFDLPTGKDKEKPKGKKRKL